MSDESGTDFAVAAYREDDAWTVAPLPLRVAADLSGLVAALRQLPAESGALGLVSIGDEFCLLLRVRGTDVRLLLSDAAVAEDWAVGRQALDTLEDEPDDEDAPTAGDSNLLADLGVPAMELSAIFDDEEAYPDELLGQVAERLGFGPEFDRAIDGTL